MLFGLISRAEWVAVVVVFQQVRILLLFLALSGSAPQAVTGWRGEGGAGEVVSPFLLARGWCPPHPPEAAEAEVGCKPVSLQAPQHSTPLFEAEASCLFPHFPPRSPTEAGA